MPWGVAAAAVGAYGAIKSSNNNKEAAQAGTTQTQTLNPAVQQALYGDGTNPGLIGQASAYANKPQNAGLTAFGTGSDQYLGSNGAGQLAAAGQAAQSLQNSNYQAPQMTAAQSFGNYNAAPAQAAGNFGVTAPQVGGNFNSTAAQSMGTYNAIPAQVSGNFNAQQTPTMVAASAQTAQGPQAASVNAPAQNGLNLAGAYDSVVNGNAGANPYLTQALQAGVDQTNASYAKNQTDLTNNLQRNVLAGIRSNSVLSGQYGGSRQGVAEGNAISDYTNQLTNANLQLGLANSANTTGAQAAAFNQGQDRSLSALQGLSGQQYGVASQNAAQQQAANSQGSAQQQAANLTNAGFQQSANSQNASQAQQTNLQNAQQAQSLGLANAGLAQQANSQNSAQALQQSLANTGYQQQTNQANSNNAQSLALANAGLSQQANSQNSAQQQALALANAGFTQQANSQNAAQGLQQGLANTGFQQQAGANNLAAQQQTNSLNSANQATGVGLSSGLLGQAYNYAQANNSAGLNQLGQVAGIVGPLSGLGSTSNTTSPYYSNTAGNILGGATAGLGLYNAYSNATKPGTNSGQLSSSFPVAPAGYFGADIMGG